MSSFSQEKQIIDEDCIYIFTRSTMSKRGFIAEDFNIHDNLSTHVGIGFVENKKYLIYNVDNVKKNENQSSLIKEDYNSFVRLDDIYYSSIWKYKITKSNKIKLIEILKSFERENITFDKEFKLTNSNLYCSEFVFLVLSKLDLTMKYEPPKKELNSFYSNLLKRNTLEYIPVDFFLELNCFELVEHKFY
jgi:predicted DNA binding protein